MERSILCFTLELPEGCWCELKEKKIVMIMIEEACLALAVIIPLESIIFNGEEDRGDCLSHVRWDIKAY